MRSADALHYAGAALRGHSLRSLLIVLAMAIGVGAVVVLTALGEGARGYVIGQFASLGTNLLIVLPGRSETGGAGVAMSVSGTPRDLTLEDAAALRRSALVRRVAPLVVGSARASHGPLERDVVVFGSSAELLPIRKWSLASGRFLPAGDWSRATPVCVLGARIARELFPAQAVLGQWLRIGDRRFRVIGVMAPEGRSIGVDVEDLVIVPVAAAQQLFDTASLFRTLVEARHRESIPAVKRFIIDTLRARHQGEEDVTVITQDAVLSTFDRILHALTLTLGGIAAISLVVAGILVMNVMLVAVSQRTAEIGLLKALGASARTVLLLFLTEAALLSTLGAAAGLLLGLAGSRLLAVLYPQVPFASPPWAVAAGLGVALFTGILFGTQPARRAARLDPVRAFSGR